MTAPAVDVRHGSATHPGLRGRANEDSFLASSPVFLVADGMGGHDSGARASTAAIAEFQAMVGAHRAAMGDVRSAISRARYRVDALATGERASGTTLTGVLLTDVGGTGYWLAVNIGDSRTYRFAHGRLEQITVDHSYVQELVDAGRLDPAEASTHHRRNEITRAIGAGSIGEADFWMLPAEVGDRILVCSDGLSTEVDDDGIARILAEETDPQDAATRLVHEALLHGGRDNVTVVVVDAAAVAGAADDFDTAPGGARAHEVDIDTDTRPRAVAGGRA